MWKKGVWQRAFEIHDGTTTTKNGRALLVGYHSNSG